MSLASYNEGCWKFYQQPSFGFSPAPARFMRGLSL
nr:MAG TPA: Antirestriction protein [Caudoviricetes sp.]